MTASQSSAALSKSETRPLPQVGGLPRVVANSPFGALAELMRDQYAALHRWQRDYGGVFEVRLGPASFVITANASSAAEMLIQRGQSFTRGGALYGPMKAVLGESSIVTTDGAPWRSRRGSMQPHFRQRVIMAISERVDQVIGESLEKLEEGPCDVSVLAGHATMAVGLAVMFGHELRGPRVELLATAIDYAIRSIGIGWIASRLPTWLPIPGRRRFRQELKVIHEVIDELIEARRERGEFGDDMLGMLLHMTDDGAMSTAQIRDEAVALLAAGYETTALSIAWGLSELATNPDIFERVRAEADEALSDGPPRKPSELAYTRCVFLESMRKYPAVLWIPRTACEDSELGGYPIPSGTSVLCSPYLVHHDPHAWTQPERFDPERFAEGSDEPRSRHAFMPFGLGQHMCIGQHLAMLEGSLMLAQMARSWDLALIPGREPIKKISTTLKAKDGLWLQLTPRQDADLLPSPK